MANFRWPEHTKLNLFFTREDLTTILLLHTFVPVSKVIERRTGVQHFDIRLVFPIIIWMIIMLANQNDVHVYHRDLFHRLNLNLGPK